MSLHPSMGEVIGDTVSSIVYAAVAATGDTIGFATETGIDLAGAVIGLGAGLVAGPIGSTAVNAIAKSYSVSAKYGIMKGAYIGASCLSAIAYTGTSLTTSAVIYSGRMIRSFI
jgi:hypothetical protein